jgi:hypothetical protein
MASIYTNVLSNEELQYLNQLPEVLAAKASLDNRPSGMVYFSVAVTDSIRSTLHSRFGLNLSAVSSIPMRWIKGDTAPHVDRSSSPFQTTYLLYLNDSPGELVVDSHSYPIEANTGFVFNEGLSHKTHATENTPRLLLGPMNEFAEPVGGPVTFYYPSEADIVADTNEISRFGSYTIQSPGVVGGYTHWRISATNTTGPSPQNVVYTTGNTLTGNGTTDVYYLYPTNPCFLEGTTILCQVDGAEKYIPVEDLKKGTLVKTSMDGYKSVVLVGKGTIQNPGDTTRTENRLYKCSPSKYPQLKQDLYITGCHSILEFPITEKQKQDTIKHLGKLFVTDKKYRLMACVDERAEPWNSEGTYTIWHFALDHHDEGMNYGVYANGGLLVETCNIRFLKTKSNMTLLG